MLPLLLFDFMQIKIMMHISSQHTLTSPSFWPNEDPTQSISVSRWIPRADLLRSLVLTLPRCVCFKKTWLVPPQHVFCITFAPTYWPVIKMTEVQRHAYCGPLSGSGRPLACYRRRTQDTYLDGMPVQSAGCYIRLYCWYMNLSL